MNLSGARTAMESSQRQHWANMLGTLALPQRGRGVMHEESYLYNEAAIALGPLWRRETAIEFTTWNMTGAAMVSMRTRSI